MVNREILKAARAALTKAGAIEACEDHPNIKVWRLDDAADEEAMKLAMAEPRADASTWVEADMRSAIRTVLENCSEGECSKCFDESHSE